MKGSPNAAKRSFPRTELRIYRRDGTSKLLLGVSGQNRKIGSIMEFKLARDQTLKAKLVDLARGDEPAKAIEL
jgi:hypothetical protein